jgi:hypothetical protein
MGKIVGVVVSLVLGGAVVSSVRRAYLTVVVALAVCSLATPSRAAFHVTVIDQVMTSYNGDAGVQFIEMRMLADLQYFVANSVFAAFDANGNYVADILVVPTNVSNSGIGTRWLIGTAAFETQSGITPDFVMPTGILPTGGGMVCYGGGGGLVPQNPPSWSRTDFSTYVDCLAYGTYSGPTNVRIGTPTSLNADGHSLQRDTTTSNNAADFSCADPATPENNAGMTGSMPATSSCPGPTPTPIDTPIATLTSAPTVTPTPVGDAERRCQEAKLKAQGKLQACLKKNSAKMLGGGTDMSAVCQTAFTDALTKIDAKAAKNEAACRFVDNRDGTVSDLNTGLQWEQKDNLDGVKNYADPHDVYNTYTWCIGTSPSCTNSADPPDGTVYTDFLAKLNNGVSNGLPMTAITGCFAGHCDWRLPTIVELEGILDEQQGSCGNPVGSSGPCIDPAFGPTTASLTWSATSAGVPGAPADAAFALNFAGFLDSDAKFYFRYARAVRGGL